MGVDIGHSTGRWRNPLRHRPVPEGRPTETALGVHPSATPNGEPSGLECQKTGVGAFRSRSMSAMGIYQQLPWLGKLVDGSPLHYELPRRTHT